MARIHGSGTPAKVPAQQADAAISQANPVSTTLYEVLPTTKNVRIISIAANITWATTQPTPLEVVVTIDGISFVFVQPNPVTATNYCAGLSGEKAENAQIFFAAAAADQYRAFMLEGRSVRVQARVTWATTQPTPLVCRVKYARW